MSSGTHDAQTGYLLPMLAQEGILIKVGMGCSSASWCLFTYPIEYMGLWHYTCLQLRQSRTLGSLTLVSVTTKHISLQWACNIHLSMVELPNATVMTGKTAPGNLLLFVRVYYLTTVEWKEFLPGSSLSHLGYGSRDHDLSLFLVFALWLLIFQWFSCLAQPHLCGRG